MENHNIFEQDLAPNKANYIALTPISFLQKAAFVYPEKIATVNGDVRRSWREVQSRCTRFASALNKRGIGYGDTVSIIAPNINEHFEVHFSVPMSGAVLNSINTRLDAQSIAFILQHAQTKVLITDREYSDVIKEALNLISVKPFVIDINDPSFIGGELIGDISYEEFIVRGDDNFLPVLPNNEWDAITLNYTSGTTGDPKGVVYHYRGAYLNAVSNVLSWGMNQHPVYLWTLPMFHCNGWCFPWSIAATAGTSISLRHVRVDAILQLIRKENIGYFCGAPVVLNMLNNAQQPLTDNTGHCVKVMTAGAPPPACVIEDMQKSGYEVTHTYGLTETYGPSVVCAWQEKWDAYSTAQQAQLKSRQGVAAPMLEQLMVADPNTLQAVPKDGETVGEIFMRGNIVMKGYLKNRKTTEQAFAGGWLHSGDLAVWHQDGYIEIKDRSKDVIISGGENISSVEIESVIYRHPKVQEVAVVAKKDDKWGETPCAFVTLLSGKMATEQEIIYFCRQHLASFKLPKSVIFSQLPKTSTGKVQKFVLRERANIHVVLNKSV